jgi:hypothetical protein
MQENYDIYCYNASDEAFGSDPYEIKPGELIVGIHNLESLEQVLAWKETWSKGETGLKGKRIVIKKNETVIEDRVY